MKKIIVIILIATLTLSNISLTFAVNNAVIKENANIEFDTLYKKSDSENGFEEEIVRINDQKLYFYYCNTGSNVVSFSIKNNELADYSMKDQSGMVYTLSESSTKLSHLGIKQAKQLDKITTNDMLDYMRQINVEMQKNENYLELVEQETINAINGVSTSAISYSPVSSIESQINSMGYIEYTNKIVANIPYNGVPGEVHENATIASVSKVNVYISEINISATIVAASVALATGDVLAVGIWIYDYYGNVKTALKQEFQKWTAKWIGNKWVSFYGQGNYWQVAKAANFVASVGEARAIVNPPTIFADSYYDNNAKLIEYGYTFNY